MKLQIYCGEILPLQIPLPKTHLRGAHYKILTPQIIGYQEYILQEIQNCNSSYMFIQYPELLQSPFLQVKICEEIVNEILSVHKSLRNVVILTNSEHFINRIRYFVYKKELKSNEVEVFYKSVYNQEITLLRINEDGHFVDANDKRSGFPKGFFDATLSMLMEIA